MPLQAFGLAIERFRNQFVILLQELRTYEVKPAHPSLHFKKVGKYRAGRVGLQYRALAVEAGDDWLWFWIGSHSEYDKLVG